ncbi:DUF1349 domain-containing protein [Actinotalea fermentans]|uniref:DUF1349 domain-containing protein n=1 Tax=Actinotalea fermentans TaxID=43671 RepID=A0A511YUB0_9CELL|nr:DUF1349 domain-containing protein [Actinotalea fermentans]KGM15128.1 hypothetical protein N867_11785 [Actinotalea fermentans ATCC 43279 = JCM 9966 = DSM 3133]GEN78780.1 hypothetical protein AFE02nite_05140 [Actinotalea fermentans]
MTSLTPVPWSTGRWTVPPAASSTSGDDLLLTPAARSDAWRETSYGFTRDDAPALVADLATPGAVEVTFTVDLSVEFDQAGLLVRADDRTWIKAGVELSDGVPQLGAVVTLGKSDWSVRPVPEWSGRRVTLRASRAGDAVTIRARVDDEPFALVRLAPFPPDAAAVAGPYACSPTREEPGLTVRFHEWRTGPADATLH